MKDLALNRELKIMGSTFVTILQTKLLMLLTVIWAFFTPVIPMILTTIFFILLDTFMGLMKVKYLGEQRSSNGFKRGFVPKVIIYTFVLLVVYMADKNITSEFVKHYTQFDFVGTKIVALILIFIECWSIDENFKAIFNVSLIDKFKQFLNYLKKNFRKFLDNDTEK